MATPRKTTDRQRAPKGSITSRLILSLDAETARMLGEALTREHEAGRWVNASEWIRAAIRQRATSSSGTRAAPGRP